MLDEYGILSPPTGFPHFEFHCDLIYKLFRTAIDAGNPNAVALFQHCRLVTESTSASFPFIHRELDGLPVLHSALSLPDETKIEPMLTILLKMGADPDQTMNATTSEPTDTPPDAFAYADAMGHTGKLTAAIEASTPTLGFGK